MDDCNKESKKEPKKTLFYDLNRFENKNVVIFIFGGKIVEGKLIEYDNVANCVLEILKKSENSKNSEKLENSKKSEKLENSEFSKKIIVLGKSITMICEAI